MQASKQQQQARGKRRGRGGGGVDTLTGGTRDVKPETLTFVAAQAVADTSLTTATPLPILRNFSSGNGSRAQIIEILKIWVQFFITPTAAMQSLAVYIGTKNNGATAINLSNPEVFAAFKMMSSFTAAGTAAVQDVVQCRDLTDGAGNGILVATDNIYTQVASSATGVANALSVKILYRVYGASVTEYVGIVQGQQ